MEEAVTNCKLPNTCKNDLVSNQEAISLEESQSTLDGEAWGEASKGGLVFYLLQDLEADWHAEVNGMDASVQSIEVKFVAPYRAARILGSLKCVDFCPINLRTRGKAEVIHSSFGCGEIIFGAE
jgi:hypothetical protein